jgi:uncharacterized protein (DUF169 family)
MGKNLSKDEIAELSKKIREKAHLTYIPIGLSLVEKEEDIPKDARRPSTRGQTCPVCLAENIVRTIGWTIALTVDDNFCVLASAGLGFIELPDYMKEGAVGSHHTKTKDLGKKFQDLLEKFFFKPGSKAALILTPATNPLVVPEGVVFYGNPSQIGKIAKGDSWYRGEAVPAAAGGLGACVVAAWAAMIDRRPRIVLPCSGEKILGHTEENDIFLATPVEELPHIAEGMEQTDYMLPYPTAKWMTFEPRVPKDYPIDVKTYKAWKKDKQQRKS